MRQTEGLIGSIMQLLGLALCVPDHTTLSRRAKTLEVLRPRPRRDGEPRATEVNVAVHALNRMLEFGRPISVRIA